MTELNNNTTSTIKAIDTKYKGYLFRSRLEARWAVFFDALGIPWEYEKEGFEKDIGIGDKIRYLPDFYLPGTETWVEVKGSTDALKNDASRLEWVLDFNSPVPYMQDSFYFEGWSKDYDYQLTHGLIILGNIPEPRFGLTLHPIIQHHKGLLWSWCEFRPKRIKVAHDDYWLSFLTRSTEEWSVEHFHFDTPFGRNDVANAYEKARQSRFEHGDCGG